MERGYGRGRMYNPRYQSGPGRSNNWGFGPPRGSYRPPSRYKYTNPCQQSPYWQQSQRVYSTRPRFNQPTYYQESPASEKEESSYPLNTNEAAEKNQFWISDKMWEDPWETLMKQWTTSKQNQVNPPQESTSEPTLNLSTIPNNEVETSLPSTSSVRIEHESTSQEPSYKTENEPNIDSLGSFPESPSS